MMHYDLVIVGGGLVGTSLALALKDTALKIALIDAKSHVVDARLFALSKSTCQFLESLNVWSGLLPFASSIRAVHVSVKGKFGTLVLDAEDISEKELGFLVPASHLEKILSESLSQASHLDVYRPATLCQMDVHADSTALGLKYDNQYHTLRTKFVIAADGAHSFVRQAQKMAATKVPYHATAIVTRTLLKNPHQNVAYERFTNEGVIAMLPMIGKEYATIWTIDDKLAQKYLECREEEFLKALQAAFGQRLGRFAAISKRYHYPLQFVKAEETFVNPVFLIGNAAHSLHPIAAQGFNLGTFEASVLANVLKGKNTETLCRDDFAAAQKIIKQQQEFSIQFSHQLARFSHQLPGIFTGLLPLGLMGLNAVPIMKQKLLQALLGNLNFTPTIM